MPKECEKSAKAEKDTAPQRRQPLATTRAAKVAAAALSIFVPSTAVAPVSFLNPCGVNSIGEGMQPQRHAPRTIDRQLVENIQRSFDALVPSDPNVAAVNRNAEDRDAVTNNVRRFIELLRGERDSLFGISSSDVRDAAARYARFDDFERTLFMYALISTVSRQFTTPGGSTRGALHDALLSNLDTSASGNIFDYVAANAPAMRIMGAAVQRVVEALVPSAAAVPTRIEVGEAAVARTITEESINAAIADLRLDLSEFTSHEFTESEEMALSWLKLASAFFPNVPATELPTQLPEFQAQVRAVGRAIASRSGEELTDEQIDGRILEGLSSLSVLFGGMMAGIISTEANALENLGRRIFTYFRDAELDRLKAERGVALDAEARALDAEARRFASQKVSKFLEMLQDPGVPRDIRLMLESLGIPEETITDVTFYGEERGARSITEVMRRFNSIIADRTLTNSEYVDLRFTVNRDGIALDENAFECRAIRNGFVRALDRALVDPFREITQGLSGGRMTRIFSGLGRGFGVLGKIPTRAFGEVRGGTSLSERAGGGAALLAWGIGIWALADEIGQTLGLWEREWGPLATAGRIFGGGGGGPTPSAAVRPGAPLAPVEIRPVAEPAALAEDRAFLQEKIQPLLDIYNTIVNANPDLRGPLADFWEALLGCTPEKSASPAGLRNIRMRRSEGVIQDLQRHLETLKNAIGDKTRTEAALAFYEAFFGQILRSQDIVNMIRYYTSDDGVRIDAYKKLYDASIASIRYAGIIAMGEAELFNVLRTTCPRFMGHAGPLADVIDAQLMWRSGREGGAPPGPEEYLDAWVQANNMHDALERIGGTPSVQDVALAVAEKGLERYSNLLRIIQAAFPPERLRERLNAYTQILSFASDPNNVNMPEQGLIEEFLRQQLGPYTNMRNALRDYFFDAPELYAQTGILLIRLVNEARTELPGRMPDEAYIYSYLQRRFTQTASREVRNLLDFIYARSERAGQQYYIELNGQNQVTFSQRERGGVAFDSSRFVVLMDALQFLEANQSAPEEQRVPPQEMPARLQQHFVDSFTRLYGNVVNLNTVIPERQFDFVASILPLTDANGAIPSSEMIRQVVNAPTYWGMRTPKWLIEYFSGLPELERAKNFVNLPENLQREYWNDHPDERASLYEEANRDRAWGAAHGRYLSPHWVVRRRERYLEYPEWR